VHNSGINRKEIFEYLPVRIDWDVFGQNNTLRMAQARVRASGALVSSQMECIAGAGVEVVRR
jgi:hypothetical protein